MKSFKDLNKQVVQEGRPSQRHPLEGHEYHKKSDEALIHIAKDAHAAAEAMKSHNTTAENKYRDQANDSATVRYFRKKNGMPEWYKKKYGHVKEGVVEEGENNQVKDGDPCWTGYQMVGMKNKGGKKVPNCVPVKEAKEKTEYDYEGDMARGQLQSIINNAQRVHDMLEDNDNLPEWVQSKITLAEDYISTVANYMMSEVDEEVVAEGLNDANIQSIIVNTVERLFYKNNLRDYDSLEAIRQGVKHHFSKPGATADSAVTGITNILDKRMRKSGKYFDLSRFKEALRQGLAHQMKKQGVAEGTESEQEEVEQIDELSKDTLKSYMDKSSKDNLTSLMKPGMIAKKHAAKRFIGMMKAGEKLTKEANSANMPADIGTPAQLSLKPNPKKLETPVYESRQLQIVREAMADAKKKDAAKKKEKKVNPGGDDKFQAEPELTSSITKNT